MPELPPVTCPAAEQIEGATPIDGGCVCGIMRRDQERKDSLLEGAPIGVFIRFREDPSTYLNLCAGKGEPLVTPNELENRDYGDGHHTGCPIWEAAVKLDLIDELMKGGRIYEMEDRPEERPATPGFTETERQVSWH